MSSLLAMCCHCHLDCDCHFVIVIAIKPTVFDSFIPWAQVSMLSEAKVASNLLSLHVVLSFLYLFLQSVSSTVLSFLLLSVSTGTDLLSSVTIKHVQRACVFITFRKRILGPASRSIKRVKNRFQKSIFDF